ASRGGRREPGRRGERGPIGGGKRTGVVRCWERRTRRAGWEQLRRLTAHPCAPCPRIGPDREVRPRPDPVSSGLPGLPDRAPELEQGNSNSGFSESTEELRGERGA